MLMLWLFTLFSVLLRTSKLPFLGSKLSGRLSSESGGDLVSIGEMLNGPGSFDRNSRVYIVGEGKGGGLLFPPFGCGWA